MCFKKISIECIILYVLSVILGFAGMILFAAMMLGNETANVIILFIALVGFFIRCMNVHKNNKEYEAYQHRHRRREESRRRVARNHHHAVAPVHQHPAIVIPAPRPVVTSSFYDYEADC